jgi:heme-degrading monooxygenase HmoA
MHVIVWTYEVPAESRAAFEAAYGPNGSWALLFARAPGFVGVELLHDGGGRYATLDRWRDEAAFAAFKADHQAAYDALDTQCAALTASEHKLGAFNLV